MLSKQTAVTTDFRTIMTFMLCWRHHLITSAYGRRAETYLVAFVEGVYLDADVGRARRVDAAAHGELTGAGASASGGVKQLTRLERQQLKHDST